MPEQELSRERLTAFRQIEASVAVDVKTMIEYFTYPDAPVKKDMLDVFEYVHQVFPEEYGKISQLIRIACNTYAGQVVSLIQEKHIKPYLDISKKGAH